MEQVACSEQAEIEHAVYATVVEKLRRAGIEVHVEDENER